MTLRISKLVLAVVVAAGVFHADVGHAGVNTKGGVPLQLTSLEWLVQDVFNGDLYGRVLGLQLTSLEWLVQDSDVIVRGVVVDVAADQNWNIVTLDVLETLKGAKTERLKFAAYKLDKADAALAPSKESKRESVWILKRHDSGVPGEAPEREKLMARHKIELHAPFLPGRPGAPSLPVIPVGQAFQPDSQPKSQPGKADLQEKHPVAFLTIDLRLLKTSDELVKEIRACVSRKTTSEPVRSYCLTLPPEIGARTGFSGLTSHRLVVPVDARLEELGRRLVLSPGDFLANGDPDHKHMLRLEGVKTLRLFRTEENLAIIRAWLDDPASTQPFKNNVKAQSTDLVPAMPKSQQSAQKIVLPKELAQVPEIHFQQPLTKAMNTADAQLHTAITIDSVHLLNQKKTDAFILAMMQKRPDLAGLSFAMGEKCRMKPEAGRQFVAALDVFRKVESQWAATAGDEAYKRQDEAKYRTQAYRDQAKEKKIDPSASVASLMQVLGHENAKMRGALVEYLAGLANVDATRALAKLAIFSEEAEIRMAAVSALNNRSHKDYSDILLAGLNYPWPEVALRSSYAVAKLDCKELIPKLIDVLEKPDPRAPQSREIEGKKTTVVRELVRVNHHHNCLLCHAPATTTRDNASKEEAAKLEGLTAQVPVPSESMVAYYRPSDPEILVRLDVTYLRQDFSLKLPVANADPWPEMQRYDFLVRTREVTEQEALAYQKLLEPSQSEPYRRAALLALRDLTGLDAEPTAAAWRKAVGP